MTTLNCKECNKEYQRDLQDHPMDFFCRFDCWVKSMEGNSVWTKVPLGDLDQDIFKRFTKVFKVVYDIK